MKSKNAPEIAFVTTTWNPKDWSLKNKLVRLSLRRAFEQGSISRRAHWSAHVLELPEPFAPLRYLSASTRKVFCYVSATAQACMVLATDKDLLIVSADGIRTVAETKGDVSLQKIEPIMSIDGSVYFVEQAICSQSSSVIQARVAFDTKTKKWEWARKTIFTVASVLIQAIQFDQESAQMADLNYTYGHSLLEADPLDSINQMYVFCSTLEVIKIRRMRQDADGTFKEVDRRNLQNLVNLQDSVDSLQPFETVCLSNRTLVIRDKLFSLETGKVYPVLPHRISEGKTFLSSSVVERTEKLSIWAEDKLNGYIMLKNDPGRRNNSLVGRFLRDVLSATSLTKNSILFQLRDGDVVMKNNQY